MIIEIWHFTGNSLDAFRDGVSRDFWAGNVPRPLRNADFHALLRRQLSLPLLQRTHLHLMVFNERAPVQRPIWVWRGMFPEFFKACFVVAVPQTSRLFEWNRLHHFRSSQLRAFPDVSGKVLDFTLHLWANFLTLNSEREIDRMLNISHRALSF